MSFSHNDAHLQDKYVEFRGYPYSNCSAVFNVDPDLCRENCLQRLQTIECCNVKDADIPKVKKGKWMKRLNYTQPDLKLMDSKQMSMGEHCLFHTKYELA